MSSYHWQLFGSEPARAIFVDWVEISQTYPDPSRYSDHKGKGIKCTEMQRKCRDEREKESRRKVRGEAWHVICSMT